MILTKRARRIVAVLTVPAFLVGAAACGSDDSDSPSADEPVAAVSGEPGRPPEISVEGDAAFGEETVTDVLTEGDGAKVAEGDFVRLDVVGRVANADLELVNTWPDEGAEGDTPRQQYVVQPGVESTLPQTATESLVGKKVGSRVLVEGRVSEMLGAGAEQAGIPADDGVVWVFDIAATAAVDPQGEAQGEQAATEEGLPEVEAPSGEPATITIPEGEDPPAELQEQVLIEGDGAEVEAGQGLVAQYTGVLWDGGEKFDSSWDRGMASGFQIGTGSVVQGWDQGLVGKHVGDRVLLVIPPDLGYGPEEQAGGAIPGDSTLVFVVDIVGTV
ncbi:FKBP-type peptidyl-prolyl cis-trans isomerase [Streptomyces sp. NBC_01803]|uniref:FKBP-type peptidyl-prolyl cis-trans isomerase n=1 Tax=Streptomyces sp. NBC_01803 TaxID=2975946 RepID=UPI002DD9C312|nr:FKBP-type peptidyl-prolyl cis-trans isomerase [Streptomyces sp. NBC_01803]WSA47057.1 FKBP-type peptidyl-prolyl cis-trans isomerase [Streptomyces sp. NBC_01803]